MKSLFLVLGMNSVQFIQLYMFQNRIEQINFLELKITIFSVRSWSRLEPPFFCPEPESAPGPWASGAGHKSGGSATLLLALGLPAALLTKKLFYLPQYSTTTWQPRTNADLTGWAYPPLPTL